MNILYTTKVSPIRQSAKQRQSSQLAEAKFSKINPLSEKYYPIKQNSEFSSNVMMNRYLMKNASLNNVRNLHDYTSTVYEVLTKKAA
jgi:hypothetical protein